MEHNRKAGLICSVAEECEYVLDRMNDTRVALAGTARLISGKFGESRVVVAIAGMGKVNAAYGSGVLIERYRPDMIINFGIGGCYSTSGLSVGDVAAAEEECYADEGVITDEGFRGAREIGIPLLKKDGKSFYNRIPADPALVRTFRDLSPDVTFKIVSGTFLTVSTVSGTMKRAKELKNSYGGICENMEGAAVFHIAHAYGVPCFEIRGVSNVAGERDRTLWDIAKAARNCQEVLLEYLRFLN